MQAFLSSSHNFNQKQKIESLRGLFDGEKCYILSCGPTLLENSNRQDRLRKELSKHLTICVKQAYDIFPTLTDIHLYNCANYKKYSYKKRPLLIEASTKPSEGSPDIHFAITNRDLNSSLAIQKNFDDWTFSTQPDNKPYGPGILYECGFFLLEHLGISECITVGWDMKLTSKDPSKQHFYEDSSSECIEKNNVGQLVSIASLESEVNIANQASASWHEWLLKNGCELKICSSLNTASEKIERVEI